MIIIRAYSKERKSLFAKAIINNGVLIPVFTQKSDAEIEYITDQEINDWSMDDIRRDIKYALNRYDLGEFIQTIQGSDVFYIGFVNGAQMFSSIDGRIVGDIHDMQSISSCFCSPIFIDPYEQNCDLWDSWADSCQKTLRYNQRTTTDCVLAATEAQGATV